MTFTDVIWQSTKFREERSHPDGMQSWAAYYKQFKLPARVGGLFGEEANALMLVYVAKLFEILKKYQSLSSSSTPL